MVTKGLAMPCRPPRPRRVTVSAHLPARPTWTCTGCGVDWPCPTRRAQLAAEFAEAPVSLGVYLGACLADAAGDLPAVPAGVLYHRFLAWLRYGPASSATPPTGPRPPSPRRTPDR